MDNYEKLMAHPDVENCHPKFIATVNGKRELVAEAIDGTVYLTAAGRDLLDNAPVVEEEKPAKKGKKAAPVVESANALVDSLGELNLSE